jgi:hypothetical protein
VSTQYFLCSMSQWQLLSTERWALTEPLDSAPPSACAVGAKRSLQRCLRIHCFLEPAVLQRRRPRSCWWLLITSISTGNFCIPSPPDSIIQGSYRGCFILVTSLALRSTFQGFKFIINVSPHAYRAILEQLSHWPWFPHASSPVHN